MPKSRSTVPFSHFSPSNFERLYSFVRQDRSSDTFGGRPRTTECSLAWGSGLGFSLFLERAKAPVRESFWYCRLLDRCASHVFHLCAEAHFRFWAIQPHHSPVP